MGHLASAASGNVCLSSNGTLVTRPRAATARSGARGRGHLRVLALTLPRANVDRIRRLCRVRGLPERGAVRSRVNSAPNG